MATIGLLKKGIDYISIACSDDDLRMAHLRVDNSSCEVINVSKRDIRGIPEEELPKAVKSILSDFKVKQAKAVYVVPSHLTTTKNIEIPSLDPAEIKSIINLQAGRHTPYSREEIIIDYLTIGVFQRNYSKVLLVIVNRNAIKKQMNILEQAGLKVQKAFFASEAIARFYSKALNLTEGNSPIGIIDIGGHFTDFTIGFHGAIIACRSIPVGITHLRGEGQPAQEKLIAELKRSVESYQGEDIEKLPENYFLTSDTALMKDLQPLLKDVFKSNVKIASYLDNLKVDQNARRFIAGEESASFLDVIAPVAVLHESQIDLLPEEIKMQRSIEEKGKEVIKAMIFSIILFILVCAWFFVKIYFKSSFLMKLQVSHETTRKEAEMLGRISEKTSIVKDHLNSRLVSLNAINELYRIIPEEIYLNSVVLDDKGEITIQGTSESMSRVFSLVTALEESTLFKNVKTNSTTAKRERGKDVAAFELVFRLESAKDDTQEEIEAKEEAKAAKAAAATAVPETTEPGK